LALGKDCEEGMTLSGVRRPDLAAAIAKIGYARAPLVRSRYLGLDFFAPFALGEPLPESGSVDVVVILEQPGVTAEDPQGQPLAVMRIDGKDIYTLYSTHDGYFFRFHRLFELRVSEAGNTVRCRSAPGADAGFLRAFVAGAGAALLMVLRGRAVLHASAVLSRERAVLFSGPSGSGKTTLAALCCASGSRLISDDVVPLQVGNDGVTCTGLGSELRLREQVRSIAGMLPEAPLGRCVTADGRLSVRLQPPGTERNLVSAVVFPQPDHATTDVTLHRLGPSEAVARLLANARLPAMLPTDWQQAHLQAAGALASSVPVVEARVPWGPPFSPAVASRLTELLEEL